MTPFLFQVAPHLAQQKKISWIPLVNGPTPVHSLLGAEESLGSKRIFIKREDATAAIYGGNKVRNLEFLLGTAIARGAKRVATVAPFGSNFVAAMAAQAKRIGMPSEVFHFTPSLSEQMERHARFSSRQGMQMKLLSGGKFLGAARAQAHLLARRAFSPGTMLLPPGGSNALGVLGHVNAAFELAMQVRAGEIPEPDLLVVGVGTCGTMAGLLAGIRLSGLKTRVLGVRCVDPIFCNRLHIAHLANGALELLRSSQRIRLAEIDLRDPEGKIQYGRPLGNTRELIESVYGQCGVELDTTYTTKVFSYLGKLAKANAIRDLDILYWHTYSSAAMKASVPIERKLLYASVQALDRSGA